MAAEKGLLWEDFKTTCLISKGLLVQYTESPSVYELFADDGAVEYVCTIFKDGGTPQTEFEASYKPGANARIDPLINGTAKAIVRGGIKGSTTAADVTSSASGSNRQLLDVARYDGAGNLLTYGAAAGSPSLPYGSGIIGWLQSIWDKLSTLSSAISISTMVSVPIIKQAEYTVTVRTETTVSACSYTVTAGKSFYLVQFNGAYDGNQGLAFRLKINGSTLYKISLSGGGNQGDTNGFNPAAAVKIASAGEAITVTGDAGIGKGQAWVGYVGFEA